MAASVVYHMFKYADVIKDWPHLEHTKHEKGIYSVLNINFKRLVTLSHNLFIQRRRLDYTEWITRTFILKSIVFLTI